MTDFAANRESLRHAGLSYFLLAILIWASYSYMFRPMVGMWRTHVAETESLRQTVQQKQLAARKFSSELIGLQKQLNHRLSEGQVSPLNDASLISHELQQQIKTLLNKNSGTVIQLSPNTVDSAKHASDSLLDIRFRIAANRLDGLLLDLSRIKPTVFVHMLSLRQASIGPSTKPYKGLLEVSLILSVAYFDERLIASLESAGIDISVIEAIAKQLQNQAELELKLSQYKAPQAHLAGLFDVDFRLRLRDPRPDQYRLAAITVSSDAQVAVIADPLRDITHRLRVGEFLNDWRIETIEQQGVSLVRGEQTVVLRLPAQ